MAGCTSQTMFPRLIVFRTLYGGAVAFMTFISTAQERQPKPKFEFASVRVTEQSHLGLEQTFTSSA